MATIPEHISNLGIHESYIPDLGDMPAQFFRNRLPSHDSKDFVHGKSARKSIKSFRYRP